jgi:pimeloyl-ACP methyl ester carboxylesterase
VPEIALPQGTVRYRDDGEGPPVVFVHGALVDGSVWAPAVERLDGFRRVVPDLPLGSHRVPVPHADLRPAGLAQLIADFLGALGLHDVTLVGNDTGGALCQLVVTNHPARVGRLVLTNCDAFDNFPPKLFAYFKPMARIPGAFALTAQTMRIKPLRRTPIAFGQLTKSRIPEDMLDDWLDPALENPTIREDTRKFILGTSPSQTMEAARKLESFDRPTLFAWAPEDRWFKVEHADRLAASMPDARVERIPDSRTFVSIDQPDRLADAIRDFVISSAESSRSPSSGDRRASSPAS